MYTFINYFFPHICALYVLLNELCDSHVLFISAMGVKMKVKFDKYWDASNMILSIASVLDSRYKMDTLEFYMKNIYGSQREGEGEKRIKTVKNCLMEMYNEYSLKVGNGLQNDSTLVYIKKHFCRH